MTNKDKIDVIQHHMNGGKVECYSKAQEKWIDDEDPVWDFSEVKYRAKPEPLVVWIVYNEKRNEYFVGNTKESYDRFKISHPTYTIKKFIEEVL